MKKSIILALIIVLCFTCNIFALPISEKVYALKNDNIYLYDPVGRTVSYDVNDGVYIFTKKTSESKQELYIKSPEQNTPFTFVVVGTNPTFSLWGNYKKNGNAVQGSRVDFNGEATTNRYDYYEGTITWSNGYATSHSIQRYAETFVIPNNIKVFTGTYAENEEDILEWVGQVEIERAGANGIAQINNPTFTVKAGYGLILELNPNTLGISQYIDTSSTPAKAPLFGKWITGASEHFSNNFQYVYNSKTGTEINFTRENGGVLKYATKGSHYTDMGAASNYKYYMLLNPPTNWKGDEVSYTIPVTVRITGSVTRAILYPTTYNWQTDSVYLDAESDRAPITYIDNNGQLEEREITGNIDINNENPDIKLNNNNIGNTTEQVDISNNADTNAISGIKDLLNQNNDSSNKIIEEFTEFFGNIKGIYTWIPLEVFNIIVAMFSIVLAIYVIKLFR